MVHSSRLRAQDLGVRASDSVLRFHSPPLTVSLRPLIRSASLCIYVREDSGLGFKVWSLRFRAQGLRMRVEGWGCRFGFGEQG